jgi:transposase
VETFPTCPVTELARLGRTLRQWKTAFFAYFDTGRASNGGTEAINGLIDSTAASPAGSPTATTTA